MIETSTIPNPTPNGIGFTASVDAVSEQEWNTWLPAFSDASLYQTWGFSSVSWGETQTSRIVLKQADRPVALAQLRLARIPLVNRGVAQLRWGPVCLARDGTFDRAIYQAMARAIVDEYVERRHLLLRVIPRTLREDPFAEDVRQIWTDLGFQPDPEARVYHTFRVDLTRSVEHIRKGFDGKWRNQLNGAERNGLEILEGTGTDLYQTFLDLYREMMARKQFETSVDPEEFGRIQERLPDPQKMLVLISRKEGRPMTALVGSVVGDTGIYLLGATSDEGMKTKGSYLLQWTMMQRLKERGCRWYDLGGINRETNPGVYHFKEGMGGTEAHELGRLSLAGGSLSTLTVAGAEHLRKSIGRLKSFLKNRSTPTTSPSA